MCFRFVCHFIVLVLCTTHIAHILVILFPRCSIHHAHILIILVPRWKIHLTHILAILVPCCSRSDAIMFSHSPSHSNTDCCSSILLRACSGKWRCLIVILLMLLQLRLRLRGKRLWILWGLVKLLLLLLLLLQWRTDFVVVVIHNVGGNL